jgi:hypothetical protein
MAVSTWGPMRMMEIARLTGESARFSSNWNGAATYLEGLGILIRHKKHPTHLVVGLDRRRPAHREIRRFGKALYDLYLRPTAPWTPAKRRPPLPAPGTDYDPTTLDLHVLGDRARGRLLHQIVEMHSCPGYVLVQSLGLSLAAYTSIKDWEDHGVVSRRYPALLMSRKRHAVHLDTVGRRTARSTTCSSALITGCPTTPTPLRPIVKREIADTAEPTGTSCRLAENVGSSMHTAFYMSNASRDRGAFARGVNEVHNLFGHPAQITLATLQRLGTTVYRTIAAEGSPWKLGRR